MVSQVTETYEAKDERMAKYLTLVQSMMIRFESIVFEKIPLLKNKQVDVLANLTFTLPWFTCNISLESFTILFIDTSPVFHIESQLESCSWVMPILKYLRTGELSDNGKQVFKLRSRATRYCLIGNELYKRSFTGPYLKCLIEKEIHGVFSDLHEDTYGNHIRGRSLC